MLKKLTAGVICSALVALTGTSAAAQSLTATPFVTGLSQPVGIVQHPQLANVQFIIEKAGRIRVVQNGSVLPTPFLDITTKVESAGEQGLLGFAFAPDFATSGRVFVSYVIKVPVTPGLGNSVIARFVRSGANPLVADPSTEFDLVWPDGNFFVTQPFGNHKGGNIAFGPDGMLYIGLGDGGSGGDPFNNSQNPATLLGKMLRINVNVLDSDPQGYDVPGNNPFVGMPGVLGEIWAFGLRNPWRWSFDDASQGGTGALVLGDVGEGSWEEINYEPAGHGGRNYGWRRREGMHDFNLSLPPFTPPAPFPAIPLTDPIHEYAHGSGSSVTGGIVYRGSALGSGFQGRYFFADFIQNRVFSLGLIIGAGGQATVANVVEHTAQIGAANGNVASFGVNASGELFIVSLGGTVYLVGPAAGPALPPPAPGGCATPDPFASLGGGTCSNGGWLPPGITPPGSTPAPPAPPPPPLPPAGGLTCSTPDPFSAIGGGTCYNGGWLPPGLTPPNAPPSPPPAPVPTTPPPSGGGTCSTPDPFASLGGGSCFNGGWLPPGFAPPSGTPALPSAPPPPVTGCLGPDPFVGIPGLVGICINGGWIPVNVGG
jgi:glucose/arabinose dehydrogenase